MSYPKIAYFFVVFTLTRCFSPRRHEWQIRVTARITLRNVYIFFPSESKQNKYVFIHIHISLGTRRYDVYESDPNQTQIAMNALGVGLSYIYGETCGGLVLTNTQFNFALIPHTPCAIDICIKCHVWTLNKHKRGYCYLPPALWWSKDHNWSNKNQESAKLL